MGGSLSDEIIRMSTPLDILVLDLVIRSTGPEATMTVSRSPEPSAYDPLDLTLLGFWASPTRREKTFRQFARRPADPQRPCTTAAVRGSPTTRTGR